MHTDPTVLVVEDNEWLADMYAEWLAETYAVVTANDGRTALDLLDDRVDVVLLDRLIPGLSGAEVLAAIRERNLDCRVAIVTAVEPNVDIVEMGFDDYLVKPVFEGDLYHTVEALLTRATYPNEHREYHALTEKRDLLEGRLTADELSESEEYAELTRRRSRLGERLRDSPRRQGERDGFGLLFRRLSHRVRKRK